LRGGGGDFDKKILTGECSPVTWTRAYDLPEGYMQPFLGFGIVKFPNGLVVSGQLDVENPVIGMKLEANVGVIKEGAGQDNYGFIFKQADSED